MFQLNWTPGVTLDQLERHAIEQAFRFYQGNKSATARALDIAVRTLEAKLEKYAADDKRTNQLADQQRVAREDLLRRQRGLVSEQSTLTASNGVGDRAARDGKATAESAEGNHDDDAQSRIRLESAERAAEKPAVPMPVRKEVQGVSSQHSAASSSGKRR
jgi:hypothetical protein